MNSAGRLLASLDHIAAQGDDRTVAQEVWMKIFNLPANHPDTQEDVLAGLHALRNEVRLTRDMLKDIGVPPELLSPGLANLEGAANPALLTSSWSTVRGPLLPPDVRVSLMWAAWVLRDHDESDLADDERDRLLKAIAEMESQLLLMTDAPYCRAVIRRHTADLRRALQFQSIGGPRSVETAVRSVLGECAIPDPAVNAEVAKASSDTKTGLQRFEALLQGTAKYCDIGSKIKKGYDDGSAVIGNAYQQIGPPLWGFTKPLLDWITGDQTTPPAS